MDEMAGLTDAALQEKIRDMEAEMRRNRQQMTRLQTDQRLYESRLRENQEKLKMSTQLPHMVANVGELLDVEEELEEGQEGSGFAIKKTETQAATKKAIVIKTTARHTIYLPVLGMVEPEDLKPGDLIAVNKESFIIYEKLPTDYDSRVKAMEIDERPSEEYSDIGGLDKQIEELVEAIVLPMTHKERFQKLGIRPPKGLLMHGPPGTGKTLMARACAAQT